MAGAGVVAVEAWWLGLSWSRADDAPRSDRGALWCQAAWAIGCASPWRYSAACEALAAAAKIARLSDFRSLSQWAMYWAWSGRGSQVIPRLAHMKADVSSATYPDSCCGKVLTVRFERCLFPSIFFDCAASGTLTQGLSIAR